MKYFLCIFQDDKNKVFQTNSLREALDWWKDNKELKDD